MKGTRRKAVARVKRAKHTKRPTKYAAAPTRTVTPFELLHAAHRGRMSAAVAATAADQLRSVAQVIGLATDTSRRRGELPPAVASAISAADAILASQIGELDWLAGEAPLGPVNVGEVLTRTVAIVRGVAGPAIRITLADASAVPPIRGSALDLAEIVFALLRNSSDALRKNGGRIHVSAGKSEDGVRIVVQDDGPGLTPMVKRRLFEPMARPRADGPHLGLGLAVARELARRSDGELVYETRPGQGARFVLTAPRWVSPRVRRSSSAR